MITNLPETRTNLDLRERNLSEHQMRQFEGYLAEIFAAFGMDDSPSTADTPRRFLNALQESTSGYDGDPKLITLFQSESTSTGEHHFNQIIEGPIEFHALCEHHALPFFGHAWIGYIADDQILGLSKLTRLVRLFAQRFTVQERLGQQIADAMMEILHPHGVAVYLEATHMCMHMRGVRDTGSLTRTTFWRGDFVQEATLRAEFLTACRT